MCGSTRAGSANVSSTVPYTVGAERLVAADASEIEIDTAVDPEAGLLGDVAAPVLLGANNEVSFPEESIRGESLRSVPGTL